ncbi:SGNH/GDSL hydrolase family protein, partial [Klebsiella oxytoca]
KAEKYRDWRGFEPGMITESVKEPDIGASTECEELTEKSEKYYRAILALAKERNIPVMVVVAPFASMTEEDL